MSEGVVRLTVEHFDIANAYLLYGTVDDTAEQMQVPRHEVVKALQTPEVKRYLDGVYLDQGYRNRDKIGKAFDRIIQAKLEEAEESGEFSKKDLAEILMMQHKMRMEEIKASQGPSDNRVQIANINGGSKYDQLMESLLNGKSS